MGWGSMETDDTLVAALETLNLRKSFSAAAPIAMARFRDALKAANPQLNADQLEAYAEHFSAQIPALTDVMMAEHVSTLLTSLSEEERAVLHEFTDHPRIKSFLEILQKNSALMNLVVQKIMREDGVRVHKESFNAALNTL